MSTTQKRFADLAPHPWPQSARCSSTRTHRHKSFMGRAREAGARVDPKKPPDIVATQGQWKVECRNHTPRNSHIFTSINSLFSWIAEQLRSQRLEQVSVDNGSTWTRSAFHSGTRTRTSIPQCHLRLDFRGNDIGDFVFHSTFSARGLGMITLFESSEDPVLADSGDSTIHELNEPTIRRPQRSPPMRSQRALCNGCATIMTRVDSGRRDRVGMRNQRQGLLLRRPTKMSGEPAAAGQTQFFTLHGLPNHSTFKARRPLIGSDEVAERSCRVAGTCRDFA